MAVNLSKKPRRHTGTVTIYRVYYLLDEVHDGDFPRDDTREEVHENVHAVEAARILTSAGLSFEATGYNWAADPDGAHTVDYATGLQCETSGHLSGFPDRLVEAIMRKVG